MNTMKARLDTWLGRFTMYRLILWVLGTWWRTASC